MRRTREKRESDRNTNRAMLGESLLQLAAHLQHYTTALRAIDARGISTRRA